LKHCISIAILAAHIGDHAAGRLRLHFGGHEAHIPKRKRGAMYEEILAAVGQEATDELLRVYGGESFYIAKDAREMQNQHRVIIAEMRAQGKTWAQIARAYTFKTSFTERWVRKLGADTQQQTCPQQISRFDQMPVPHHLDAISRRN